ncbi:DUF84 family protein [Virgibacillus sp. NKC19-16]|uniref:DUF84 family protein n=1 Tax=Virgibacillus salidurans TaxID=2831673 RepID=UPI001F388B7B|nr:DUF84 family protein [Virgibacillus sp. NKC19-16]UJL45105.1 DUF84 family protein [Virgibacillus sp. NKC19-16]
MNIIIGSTNPTKIKAVQEVFPLHTVTSKNVPSNVSSQPFSDEETRKGAINRALQCSNSNSEDTIGIGLEGGVMYVDNQLYLCNWGALVTQDGEVYTASGARIILPQEFTEPLKKGVELGDVMDRYAKKEGVRKKEGAIGIFTGEFISRQEMFAHVVKLLRGQWEYWT